MFVVHFFLACNILLIVRTESSFFKCFIATFINWVSLLRYYYQCRVLKYLTGLCRLGIYYGQATSFGSFQIEFVTFDLFCLPYLKLKIFPYILPPNLFTILYTVQFILHQPEVANCIFFWCNCVITGAKSHRTVSAIIYEPERSRGNTTSSSKNRAWFH